MLSDIFHIDERNVELDEWLTENYGGLTEKVGMDEIAAAAPGKEPRKIEGD